MYTACVNGYTNTHFVNPESAPNGEIFDPFGGTLAPDDVDKVVRHTRPCGGLPVRQTSSAGLVQYRFNRSPFRVVIPSVWHSYDPKLFIENNKIKFLERKR